MAVYVTGMLMPLSMFDVCEWQMLQKFILSLSISLYFSQCAVGNEDVIVH
jgi:hypothetical protein